MLKRFILFYSVKLFIILLVYSFVLFEPASATACSIPSPDSLHSLYLQSDLIFTAEVTGEKDNRILNETQNYYIVEVLRNLKTSSVWKGKPKRNFVFTSLEERTKPGEVNFCGYEGTSKLKIGESYLFFFKKNSKTGQFIITDDRSGFKKLSETDLYIYRKRFKEFQSIISKRENQLEAVTAWLVRLLEEPTTRWDGIFDLAVSFESLEDEKDLKEKKLFIIDKDFNVRTPQIARSLSDSQKEYISSLVFNAIDEEISGKFNESLSKIARNWDKSRLAIYTFSLLQTADKSNAVKVKKIMRYISRVLDDNELFNIIGDYSAEDSSEQAREIIEKAVTVEESKNTIGKADKSIPEIYQDNNKTEKSVESEQKVPKLTLAQEREIILREFINRYEYLLARGFPSEIEAEDESVEK